MLEKQQKPKFLNLFQINMPVTAIVSILHRLSGLILVLVLPILIYGLYMSTLNEAQFTKLVGCFDSTVFRLLLIGLVWTVAHHILAGIRYLFIDIELGVNLQQAKISAWTANLTAFIVTLVFAVEVLL